ncbi:RDD family protein [Nonomuraea antimicrobica]
MARIIDFVILLVLNFVVGLIIGLFAVASYSSLDGASSGFLTSTVAAIISGVIVTALWVAFDFVLLKMKGQTIGKMVMGIKVVPVGQALSPAGLPTNMALMRAGVTWGGWVINAIPIPIITGLLAWVVVALNGASQLWDKPLQQTFADKIAGTVVVKIK